VYERVPVTSGRSAPLVGIEVSEGNTRYRLSRVTDQAMIDEVLAEAETYLAIGET
jgi:hypothetical protein